MAAPMTVMLSRTCCISRQISSKLLRKTLPHSSESICRSSWPHHISTVSPMCYEARNIDVTGGKQTFIFDTHSVVANLQQSGFTLEQATSLKNILVDIMEASTHHQNKQMVTKPQQEIMLQQVMSNIASVRKDMIILEKSEFSQLKHEYEKQRLEINQMKQQLHDELQKLRSGVSLDMSLERARAKEDHSLNRTELSGLNNKISIDFSEVEKEMGRIDNKIDREIATLLATYERYRNDVMKYAGGTIMTCLTICLGFYRLWL